MFESLLKEGVKAPYLLKETPNVQETYGNNDNTIVEVTRSAA